MSEEHKQKVLIVHNYYQIPGGEDTVVANEKKLLEDHGHEVVLYTRHNNELKSMNLLQKLGLPFTTIFNPRTYCDVKKIIQKENIEIVHVHNTLSLISPAVYYAAVRCHVPVVQTIHNFRFLCPGATFYRDGHICEDCVSKGLGCAVKHKCYRGSRVQTLICVINTWIHRHTGILGKISFIALTEFNKEKLLQLKQIAPERVFVKPNFTFESIKTGNKEKGEASEKKSGFIYVGRLDELKGIKVLFEAWKLMGDSAPILVVCGKGPLEAWCKDYIQSQKLTTIEMKGAVSNEEAKELISKSEALILPSLGYEGFPMTVPESFSMHTPMIVGDVGNTGALITDNVNGMKYQSDSVDDLIKTVDRFERSDAIRIGNAAYVDYLENYSQGANYIKIRKIYDEVI